MKIPEEIAQAKRELSRRWLDRGLKSGVAHRSWALSFTAAVESAADNVHAVGIGHKMVSGKATREWAIRFYVVHKLAKSVLDGNALIPETVDGLPTDVIETPPAALTWPRKRSARLQFAATSCSTDRQKEQRPIQGGISCGHFLVSAGTLACFCRSTRDGDTRVFLLSNNHVLANLNQGSPGDDIYQAGRADGGTPAGRIASLERFVPVQAGGSSNRVDAAIAALLPDIAHLPQICSVGRIAGTTGAASDMQVAKHGRTTGYTEGVITDTAYDAAIGSFKFEDQVRIERLPSQASFAEPGDSGSLVLERDTRKAVGLYFAGPPSGSYGVANPIAEVLSALEIELL